MVFKFYTKKRKVLLVSCTMCVFVLLNFNIEFTGFQNFLLLVSGQNEDKKGFGIQQRDRQHQMERQQDREHADDDSFAINNISGLVLVGTVLTIVGVSIYAGYKIYSIKKKAAKNKNN